MNIQVSMDIQMSMDIPTNCPRGPRGNVRRKISGRKCPGENVLDPNDTYRLHAALTRYASKYTQSKSKSLIMKMSNTNCDTNTSNCRISTNFSRRRIYAFPTKVTTLC